MPLYTYACDEHGEFSAWGRMAESDAPQPCPACAAAAPRALARPALAGRSEADAPPMATGGEGMCMAEAPRTGSTCCGGGACVH